MSPVALPTTITSRTHAEWREQRAWSVFRDHIGAEIDGYLHTIPTPEMRELVQDLERVLAAGDHRVKLLR
jgi:hypothetical protein